MSFDTLTRPPTFTEFVDALLDIADESPTYTYPSGTGYGCTYVPNVAGSPADRRCIVGEVLIGKLNILADGDFDDDGQLADFNTEDATALFRHLFGPPGNDTDRQVVDLAAGVQIKQDDGQTWSQSVARSLNYWRKSLTEQQVARLSVLEATLQMERLV